MTRIYGCSDDLIEIDGHWSDEISCYMKDDEQCALALSDGTLLSVKYDRDGVWRFAPIVIGAVPYAKVDGMPDGDGESERADGTPVYSDVLTFDGPIAWVALVQGGRYGRK